MNEYILTKKQAGGLFPGSTCFYAGDWSDTDVVSKAKRYSLDEAMAKARLLKKFGEHYVCVRVENGKVVV